MQFVHHMLNTAPPAAAPMHESPLPAELTAAASSDGVVPQAAAPAEMQPAVDARTTPVSQALPPLHETQSPLSLQPSTQTPSAVRALSPVSLLIDAVTPMRIDTQPSQQQQQQSRLSPTTSASMLGAAAQRPLSGGVASRSSAHLLAVYDSASSEAQSGTAAAELSPLDIAPASLQRGHSGSFALDRSNSSASGLLASGSSTI